ncbi:Retrotransposon Copia-like N-terminal [Arabidopsis suecica]|uniref:Retrotransposon Copia-like N-terminal n=1 Tax=Arabidopsis suecica TaxID=45249 RepID=A0A8T1ZEL2_ARASU|nr:Retrotransposon Copia-like N-terminal [Arabidopsis suecica]
MVKKGGKQRNQSVTPEDGGSVARSNRESMIVEDPKDAMMKQQLNSRFEASEGHGSMNFNTIDNPFFLHSSDHPGLTIVSHILDGTNYNSWSIAMKISLDAKNKLGLVDGSLLRPSETDAGFRIWSRCNSMVKSWILNVVNKEIYDSILYYQDAMEMWNDLFTRFKVNNLPRKYQLEQAVMTLKQGDLDLSAYFTKKKTLWEQLSNTRSRTVKKCDCDQVKELLEEAETSRVIQFLMGLNDSFNNIRGQILNMKPRPGLNEIYNILDQDESQRIVGYTRPVSTPSAFQAQAILTEQIPILMAHGNTQKPKCSHCSRIGHTVDKCYKVHGYPPGHPRAKKNNYVGSAKMTSSEVMVTQKENVPVEQNEDMSKDQLQQMISYLSSQLQSNTISSSPDKAIASTSNSVPTISQMTGTFLSLYDFTYYDMLTSSLPHETELSHRAWVIDSGASHHVTHEREIYVEYKALERTYVRLPNGQTVKIEGTGFIQLTDALSLHDVLYIPEFKFNLLSVSVVTKTLRSKVSFTSDACSIQALTQELMIGQGSQVANLYVLNLDKSLVNVSSSTLQGTPACASIHVDSEMWHKRLGHPSLNKIESLSEVLLLPKQKINKSSHHCHICHLAKQRHLPFKLSHNMRSKPFELIHIDTWGPFSVPTVDGFRYFLTIVDDFSRATWIYMLKQKSDVLHVFPGFIQLVETQYNSKVCSVRSDNANELKFTSLYMEKGIKSFHSCPETPEQNAIVERKHQHLLNVARALMFQSGIPLQFWGDCVLTAAFLINRLPSPVLDNKTPYERLTNEQPDYSSLKAFGCLCYSSTSPKNRTKFDPRARACIFLGYPSGFKGYKLLDIETYSVSVSRHVIFHEEIFPFASSNITDAVKTFFPHFSLPAPNHDEHLPPVQSSSDAPHNHDESSSLVSIPSESKPHRQRKLPSHLQDFHCYNNNTLTNPIKTSPYPLANYISYSYLSEPFGAFINIITKTKLPTKFSEAKHDKEWTDAMGKEIGAFIRTETWSVCDLPPGKVAVGCKWVFTIKFHADGSIERYKARLVAKGYTQQEGIDFTDTFSPVAKMVTVKLLLSLAPKMQWSLHQLDISNAFLNGDLVEEIYMKLPPGYAELMGIEVSPNAVCRLHKSIYGLKQASRQWFLKFSSTLVGFGFDKCHGDHTLFVKEVNGNFLVVLVYVDDILIASTSDSLVAELKTQLSSAFQLRDLGPPKFFLGIKIARTDEGISLNQRKYILDLLESTGFSDCKPSSIPMEPNQKLAQDTGTVLADPKQYRRLIGKLQYLCITRPDITFAVSKLAQYSSAPTNIHLQAIHKILRYLKGTIGQGLFYGADPTFDLRGFSDSDWGTCPDSRRCVTGFAIFVGNSLVSWRSKKQDVVSMSSAEAEYRAMSVATKELIWLGYLLTALRVPFRSPAYLYCDNVAALHIASNSVFHERTKHIEFDCHKVRECIEAGILKTMFVRTDNQLADILTKPLYPSLFRENNSKLGVLNIYEAQA